jgi:Nif-specific ferredoxin III
MADIVTGVTRGGTVWTPAFVTEINHSHCIGCGRCYKVCPRDVLDLVERSEVMSETDLDEFEDLDEDNAMVMNIANADDCIGCEACSRVCPKNCFTHEPAALAA